MVRMRAALLCCWAVLGPCPGLVAAAEPLRLHYQERPPYSATATATSTSADGRVNGEVSGEVGGQVSGLVADRAAQALQRAGIAFQWIRTPSQRQLALIQADPGGLDCGVGWFRSDERAARGRFSAPLYRDRPLAALARDPVWRAPQASAAALLADPGLRLLVKEGYSYGPRLDAQIAAAPRPPLRTSVEPLQMARMLASGRADWMPVAPEEAEVLRQDGLRLLPLTDQPEGQTRHLYCNRAVPLAWMERIDRALAALPAPAKAAR